MLPELELVDTYSAEEEKVILDRLVAYNVDRFGPMDRKDLAIILRNEDGEPQSGLIGRTGRGWLYVQMLFIPVHLRGQGIATRLLAMAEQEAKARGCRGAYLDTMNPQARDFYLKLGYSVIGELSDLEGGHAITWLKKPFSP